MPVRLRPWAEFMYKILLISLALFIAGCSKGLIPMTGLLDPEQEYGKTSRAKVMVSIQIIIIKKLKDFLQKNLG